MDLKQHVQNLFDIVTFLLRNARTLDGLNEEFFLHYYKIHLTIFNPPIALNDDRVQLEVRKKENTETVEDRNHMTFLTRSTEQKGAEIDLSIFYDLPEPSVNEDVQNEAETVLPADAHGTLILPDCIEDQVPIAAENDNTCEQLMIDYKVDLNAPQVIDFTKAEIDNKDGNKVKGRNPIVPPPGWTNHNRKKSKVKYETNEEGKFICPHCGKMYPTLAVVGAHVSESHVEKKRNCKICHKEFKFGKQYRNHKRIHESLNCAKCGLEIPLNSKKAHHIVCYGLSKQYSCTICDYKAHRQSHIKRHMVKHNVKVKSEGTIFPCTKCKHVSTTKRSLRMHITLTHYTIPCGLCIRKFRKQETLDEHIKSEHIPKPSPAPEEKKILVCKVCPYTHHYPSVMNKHEKIHDKKPKVAKPTTCDTCGYTFKIHGSLKRHLKDGCKGKTESVLWFGGEDSASVATLDI